MRIDTLPASGVLSLNGVPIMAGQVVPFADIGKLAYTPAKDANSANLSTAPSFNFSVCDQDGAFDPVPNKFTFLITPANDPPVAPITTFIVDGGAQTGSAACLLDAPKLEGTNVLPVVSDPDLPADTLTVTVTSVPPPSSGAFYLPGSTVPLAAGATLTPAQLQQLCFVPNPALSGTPNAQGLIPGGTLAITVSDGKGGTAEGAINVLVRPQAPVARPPVTPIPPIPLIPAIVIPPLTLLGPKTNAVQIAQGLRALDDIRFSPIEAASDLDADGFFDSARIKSVWNREKVAGVQVVAADEQAAPAKKIIDCEPAKPKEKPKLKAVKRSVFADGINDAKSKAFSEQLKSAQKRFKPPVKTTPRTALGKEC